MNKAYYVKLQPVFGNSIRNKLLLLQACTEIINNELFVLATHETKYWKNGEMKTVRSFETFLKTRKRLSEARWFPHAPNEVYLGAIHLFNIDVLNYLKKKREGKLDSHATRSGKGTGYWFNRLNVPSKRSVLFELNLKVDRVEPDYKLMVYPEKNEVRLKLPALGEVVLKNFSGVDLGLVMDKPLRSIRFIERKNLQSVETNWYCELMFVDEVTDWLYLKTR